jgi:hypothetical protein
MRLIDFFEYLVRHDATRGLAHDLADAWADRQRADQHPFHPAA